MVQNTGSVNLSLVVWLLSGLYSMVGAYCYAELGCMIKKSGADYAYIMDTFGPFVGFMRLWAECLIVRPCIITIVALTFAKYAAKPFFPECEPPDDAIRLLACCCICKVIYNAILIEGVEGVLCQYLSGWKSLTSARRPVTSRRLFFRNIRLLTVDSIELSDG